MLRRGNAKKTPVGDIVVPDRRRHPSEAQIEDMRRSLRENGLLTPIGVRGAQAMELQAGIGPLMLVYGATRLEAARREGWTAIDAQILEGSDLDFRKAEIIENLHRAELTVQQRAEWTAELVKLCEEASDKPAQVARVSAKGGRGHTGGISQAARELDRDRDSVRRDLRVASIAPEAKAAAQQAGLGDNQSALLKVAAAPTAEAQVAKVEEIKKAKESPKLAGDSDARTKWIEGLKKWWSSGRAEWQEDVRLTDFSIFEIQSIDVDEIETNGATARAPATEGNPPLNDAPATAAVGDVSDIPDFLRRRRRDRPPSSEAA